MFPFQRLSPVLSASLTFVSAVSLGCGEEDSHAPSLPDFVLTNSQTVHIPGCEHISHNLCDVMQADCQQQIYQLMACLREDSGMLEQLPPIARLTVPEAIARMNEDSDSGPSMPEQELLNRVRGLELLGLVPPGEINAQTNLQETRLNGVLAYYSPLDREVVLIDHGEPVDDLESNSVLGHELVHALQDREHDLYEFGLANFNTNDEELAAVSLVEGEASWYEIMMISAYTGIKPDEIEYERLFSFLDETAARSTYSSGSAFLSARGIFPYTHGARFAAELWLNGGSQGIDARYDSPPQTTLEILYGPEFSEVVSVDFNLMPAPLSDYNFLVDDIAGSWVVHSLLQTLIGPSEKAVDNNELPFASHWRGDRFWVYHRESDDAIAALWTLNWQDEASAQEFKERIPNLVESGAAFSVWTQGTTTRVVSLNAAAEEDESDWVDVLTNLSLQDEN